jgi:hypothetical protein
MNYLRKIHHKIKETLYITIMDHSCEPRSHKKKETVMVIGTFVIVESSITFGEFSR